MNAERPIISTSDRHHDAKNSRSVDKTIEIVESIGEHNPRLVLLAGDMIEGGRESAESLTKILERLTKHGVIVIAVSGNEELDPEKSDLDIPTLKKIYADSDTIFLERDRYEFREEGSENPSMIVLGYMGSANGTFYNGDDRGTLRRSANLASSTKERREADLVFLRENLATAPSGKTTVLTHYGPFPNMVFSRKKTNVTFGGTVEYGEAMVESGKGLVVVHGHLLEAFHHRAIGEGEGKVDVYCVAEQVTSFDRSTNKLRSGVENFYTTHIAR